MKNINKIFAVTFFLFCSIIYAQEPGYKIANKFPIEGDGFWDYISCDDSAGRLFVSHGTMVQVVDASNGTIIGTIPNTTGVHGIAVAYNIGMGFTSNGRDTSVTVFRLSNLETLSVVKLINARNPDAIVYDPFTKKVFTFNGGTSNMSIIDGVSMEFVVSVPLDGKPEFAVTDGKGNIFVNIEDKSLLCKIDAGKMEVTQRWPIAPGEEPSGLAIDRENNRLFTVCGNKTMVILDGDDGHIVTTLPIGERVDAAAFDAGLKRVYSSNGDGTLTVVQEIDKDNFKVLENVQTQRGARTCTVYQKNHHIYLPTAEFNPPPEPTPETPHPRPSVKSGTFMLLDVAPTK